MYLRCAATYRGRAHRRYQSDIINNPSRDPKADRTEIDAAWQYLKLAKEMRVGLGK